MAHINILQDLTLANKMNLILQMLTGKKIPITVQANAKIGQVKRQIYHEVGIDEPLKILQGQNELESKYSLTYYGIEDGSTLQLLVQPRKNINIVFDTIVMGKISMSVEDTMTIKELRKELKTTHQLDVIAEIENMYLEDGSVIKEENIPLHYLGISEGSSLEMGTTELIRVCVICVYQSSSIHTLFETYMLPSQVSDSVDKWKKKVVKQLDLKTMVPGTNPLEFRECDIDFLAVFLKRGESYLDIASVDSRTMKDKLKPTEKIYVLPYHSGMQAICVDYQQERVFVSGIHCPIFKGTGYHETHGYFGHALKLAIQD